MRKLLRTLSLDLIQQNEIFKILFDNSTFPDAELVIEITKSSDNPYRIALIPFQGESGAAKQANEIVKNDLIRTGEFYIFDEKSLIAYPPSEEDINYSDWRLINADFLLLTSVIDSNSGIEARYEIFDVRKKSKIRSSKVYGVTNLSLIHI